MYGRPETGFGVLGFPAAGDVAVDDADDACNDDAGWDVSSGFDRKERVEWGTEVREGEDVQASKEENKGD